MSAAAGHLDVIATLTAKLSDHPEVLDRIGVARLGEVEDTLTDLLTDVDDERSEARLAGWRAVERGSLGEVPIGGAS